MSNSLENHDIFVLYEKKQQVTYVTTSVSFFAGNSNTCSLDAYTSWLSIVLKDNKLVEAIALSRESYKNVVREEASQQGFDISNIKVREGEDFSCKPAHLIITNVINAETKSELLTVLKQIKFTQLDLKLINLSGKNKSLAFFQQTVLHIRLFLCQLFILQDKTVHDLSSLYLCLLRDIM